MHKKYGKDALRREGGISSELRTKIKRVASSPKMKPLTDKVQGVVDSWSTELRCRVNELKMELDKLVSQGEGNNSRNDIRKILLNTLDVIRGKAKSE